MSESEGKDVCMLYLKRSKDKRKLLPGFSETLTILDDEAAKNGFNDAELKLIFSVIKLDIAATQRTALIKCLIPQTKISSQFVQKVICWIQARQDTIPMKPGTTLIHWLIGLLDFRLVETKVVNAFYHSFFYIMVKNKKLECHAAQLVYMLTKPQDVTRRQVLRVLHLSAKYAKPPKHLTAILALFKSFKPENVPEKIPATNVENAWKAMPDGLRLAFQDAANRCNLEPSSLESGKNIVWNPLQDRKKSKKEPLLPMTAYLYLASSIFNNENSKSIFDIVSFYDLGKYQLSLELPCNALSLLVNRAGHHILTFANSDYQSRFIFKLYNTLQRAFIHEAGQSSYKEREVLLSKIVEFSNYSQQGIVLVSRFLIEYMFFWNMRQHQNHILALLEWIKFASFNDLHDNVLVHLRTLFESSSTDIKCTVIQTLRKLVVNLFIEQGITETQSWKAVISQDQYQTWEFEDVIIPLVKFIGDLIIVGLQSTSHDIILLSEGLTFYEQLSILEERSELPLWTIAPCTVIYGSFLSSSLATISRVCTLLLRYRSVNQQLKQKKLRKLFETEITILDIYAKDIARLLLYNEAFSSRHEGYLLKSISDNVISDLEDICNLDEMLNISHHYAMMPCKFVLTHSAVDMTSDNDSLMVAKIYYPAIANFLQTFAKSS